jgi:uncharacterized protein DUF5666
MLLLLAGCGAGAAAEDGNQDSPVAGADLTVLSPPPPAALAQGPIEALGNPTITVSSIQYFVVAGQTIVRRSGVAVPFFGLKQGESAVVKGGPDADGAPVAQVIDVYVLPRPLPKQVTVKGPIAVGPDSVTVVDQTLHVDAHTLIVRAGRTIVPLSNLQNGEAATVSGRPNTDGSLLAVIINVGY